MAEILLSFLRIIRYTRVSEVENLVANNLENKMKECFLYSLNVEGAVVMFAVNYDDHDEVWELHSNEMWKRSKFPADALPVEARYQGLIPSPIPHGAVGRIGKSE